MFISANPPLFLCLSGDLLPAGILGEAGPRGRKKETGSLCESQFRGKGLKEMIWGGKKLEGTRGAESRDAQGDRCWWEAAPCPPARPTCALLRQQPCPPSHYLAWKEKGRMALKPASLNEIVILQLNSSSAGRWGYLVLCFRKYHLVSQGNRSWEWLLANRINSVCVHIYTYIYIPRQVK